MYQNLNNKPITIYGSGDQKRAFSYIDDCLNPLWLAGTSKLASKQIINLGGIKEYSINDTADIILEVMGYGKKVYLEERHEVKYAWSTWKKSQDILFYEDKTSLKDGLTEMWNWAKIQPNRIQKKWDSYEVERGIYSYWK
jgi:UDP-glucose 4-epimerase